MQRISQSQGYFKSTADQDEGCDVVRSRTRTGSVERGRREQLLIVSKIVSSCHMCHPYQLNCFGKFMSVRVDTAI